MSPYGTLPLCLLSGDVPQMRLFSILLSALVLFLCLAASSYAQGKYRFDTWTTDNGLPQNGVRQITQTPEGYLWFTTFDGLVRFDGLRFTTFNKSNTKGIINNRFTGLFGDNDGTLYATTMEDGILTVFHNGVFTSFTSDQVPGHYISRVERQESGQLRVLVEDEDRTSRSWYSFSDGKFDFLEKQLKPTNDFVFYGKYGTRWTITTSGVTELREGKTVTIPMDLSKIDFRVNTFEDREGNLWLSHNQVYCIRNGSLRVYGVRDGLPENSIYHSFWDEADGSVWVVSGGASSSTVGLVQIKDEKVSIWGKDYGLAAASIQDIYHDREGTVWLATDRGLIRRREQVIQGYSKKDGIVHSEVYPLFRDSQENIWIGTSRGLSIYRNGKFETVDPKPPSPNTPLDETWREGRMSVQSIWEDTNKKIWVGLNGGIYTIQNGIATILLKGSHVFAIKGDSAGNVWVATNKGMLRFRDYQLTGQYSVKDGLPSEFMTAIFEDSKGNVWFGGYGGLSRYVDGRFINYTVKDGLAGNYVRTIYEDSEGTFWIGTYDEGMSRFKDGQFVNYKESNGLYNSGVFAIEEDEAGFFWISSNRGIYRVNRQELNDFADGKIAKINSVGYGKEDGMLSNECNGGRQPASLRDKEGRFWFPTQEGVAIVDPKAERPNPMPPTVVIEDVLVEREPVDLRGGTSIEPGKQNIEIRYTGISLIKSDQIKFKYLLEGHDEDWIDAGTRRTAYYSYLPPGNYTFKVKAANSDGVWNENGAELKIELKPFFYQTWLFIFLCVLGASLGLLLIWKVSVHQLELREKRLTRLVAERTRELAEANENLHALANSDGLTKIGNRRRFESFLTDEWHRAVRFKTEISLIMIDIDHFKRFNDAYGHQAGDDCLQKVAEALAETIKRPTDLVARFGGEEFALVLGGTSSAGARSIAEQAVENVRQMKIIHKGSETSPFLTVSVGIATALPDLEMSEIELIRNADRALYKAKESGRDCMYFHDQLSQGPVNADVLAKEQFEFE